MRFTPGPWGWQRLGRGLGLFAQYGRRKVVLTIGKSGLQTCDPGREESLLIQASGDEPDLRLIENAPLLLRALCRAVLDGRETDKWQDNAERSIAFALGFPSEYDRRELYRVMGELRQSWSDREPVLPVWRGMTARETLELKRAKGVND